MKLSILALAVSVALAPAMAHTQESPLQNPLRDALRAMPEEALDFSQPQIMFAFVDVRALLAVGGFPFRSLAMRRATAGAFLRPVEALRDSPPDEFVAGPGFTIGDILAFSGYGMRPDGVAQWQFFAPEGAETLAAALAEDGFAEVQPGVIGDGPAREVDYSRIDPPNAWRGMLGMSSFVAVREGILIQADGPELAAAALTAERSSLDNRDVRTALAGLEALMPDGLIVEAMLFSPAAGARPAAEEGMGFPDPLSGASGVPAYRIGLAADIQATTAMLAVSLAYEDCDLAREAAKRMADGWPTEVRQPPFSSSASPDVLPVEGGCAAQLLVTQAPGGELFENMPFDVFFNSFIAGSAPLIAIDAAP